MAATLRVQRARDNEVLFKTRGFFHVVGLAAYSPGDFREFIDSLDDLTTTPASLAKSEGHDTMEALSATVAIAAIRGLLLQELLTPAGHTQDAVAMILRISKGGCAPRTYPGL
ncbi:hypothetical protein ACWF99_11585 [Nocardia sp. NPDC055002]